MRQSRAAGPPSTQSGSSSSGRGLVRGSHRDRVPHIPRGVMVPADPDKVPSKNRTKVIIILGIALPVLACIIGIIAWSVTTDVLRISPRSHDDAFNRFGHQGKTRIDILQSRNDDDGVDIFQLHGISSSTSTVPSVLLKVITQKTQPKQAGSPTRSTTLTERTTETPNVSDILSRLISDMPIPKNPKNFVVFAPVADSQRMSSSIKDRTIDGKVLVDEGEDLMAEESSYSEEVSQDIPENKLPFSRKRKSSREGSYPSKTEGIASSDGKQVRQMKQDKGSHSARESSVVKSNSQFNHQGPMQDDAPPPTNKYSSSSVNKKSSGSHQTRPNTAHNSNSDFLRTRGINTKELKSNGHLNTGATSIHQDVIPNYYPNDIKKNPKHQVLPNNSPSNLHSFQNEDRSGFKSNGNRVFTNDGKGTFQQQSAYQNQHPTGLNHGKQSFQASLSQGHTLLGQHYQPPTQQTPNSLPQAQNSSPRQNHNSPQQIHNPPLQQIPNSPQQPYNSPQPPLSSPQNNRPTPHHYHHATPDEAPNMSPPKDHPPFLSYIISPPHSSNQVPPPQSPLNQGTSRSAYNNPDSTGGSYPVDNGYQSSGKGPQYFAPPPQTFHTKVNYDHPSNNYGPTSSASTYEKAAQIAVDKSKDGLHHHHHHHHHHDQIPSNSDPIGDINLSDVPRTNDADRLGTIGVGLGGPRGRGITVQIGGGGGGMPGLLPLGALGIAKNIVASLLPRPSIGLNSKVFLGVEVGRGGGGGIGLLG